MVVIVVCILLSYSPSHSRRRNNTTPLANNTIASKLHTFRPQNWTQHFLVYRSTMYKAQSMSFSNPGCIMTIRHNFSNFQYTKHHPVTRHTIASTQHTSGPYQPTQYIFVYPRTIHNHQNICHSRPGCIIKHPPLVSQHFRLKITTQLLKGRKAPSAR